MSAPKELKPNRQTIGGPIYTVRRKTVGFSVRDIVRHFEGEDADVREITAEVESGTLLIEYEVWRKA